MDNSHDVSDSTDWLDTSLSEFAPLDAALRCEICKDFYNTPMITSCSHTFCSLCIRRTLAADGKCPTCRNTDQPSKLRRNGTVEELVERFKEARPIALKLAKENTNGVRTEPVGKSRATKRKTTEAGLDDEGAERTSQKRKTRSQSRQEASVGSADVMVVDDSEDEDFQIEDGTVPCPICHKWMKQEAVFPHLDHCEEEQEQERKAARRRQELYKIFHTMDLETNPTQRGSNPPSSNPPERITELSYGMLNEKQLRKKISDLGIPNWGSKALLIRRHTEWVNLWNANADSSNPRPKRDMLRQLDIWERTQGGSAPVTFGTQNGPSAVMNKDFDGAGWASNNKTDFDRLIEEARRKRKQTAEKAEPQAAEQSSESGQASSKLQENGTQDQATEEKIAETDAPTEPRADDPPSSSPPTNHRRKPTNGPPPYLAHAESLERAKDKIHSSQGLRATESIPERRTPSLASSEVMNTTMNGRSTLPNAEPGGGTDKERRESDASSWPLNTPMSPLAGIKSGEKMGMFEMQEHPVRDVDGDAAMQ
ncbi:MAG: E3 ubiquitin-protein ligase rad18 [Bogoriella megaspora]|nr:MAG: E3 ubiquitin-protein ligase rad18 [Bogoriella megaspora]